MNKVLAGTFLGLALALTLSVSAALADNSATIEGNGAGSDNMAIATSVVSQTVVQINNLDVQNNLTAVANSGGNEASGNTGGNTTIDTGNASSTVNVTTGGNVNTATVSCPCATPNNDAMISGNGDGSINLAIAGSSQSQLVRQKNKQGKVSNNITQRSRTGRNRANGNTGGNVLVNTGTATANQTVTTDINHNTIDINP